MINIVMTLGDIQIMASPISARIGSVPPRAGFILVTPICQHLDDIGLLATTDYPRSDCPRNIVSHAVLGIAFEIAINKYVRTGQ